MGVNTLFIKNELFIGRVVAIMQQCGNMKGNIRITYWRHKIETFSVKTGTDRKDSKSRW